MNGMEVLRKQNKTKQNPSKLQAFFFALATPASKKKKSKVTI